MEEHNQAYAKKCRLSEKITRSKFSGHIFVDLLSFAVFISARYVFAFCFSRAVTSTHILLPFCLLT